MDQSDQPTSILWGPLSSHQPQSKALLPSSSNTRIHYNYKRPRPLSNGRLLIEPKFLTTGPANRVLAVAKNSEVPIIYQEAGETTAEEDMSMGYTHLISEQPVDSSYWTMGATINPQQTSIQSAAVNKAMLDNPDLVVEVMHKISLAAVEVLESVVPLELLNMPKRHADKNVPFVYGHEDNKYFTSCQLNYSSIDGLSLKISLGAVGGLHLDGKDDPPSWTVLMKTIEERSPALIRTSTPKILRQTGMDVGNAPDALPSGLIAFRTLRNQHEWHARKDACNDAATKGRKRKHSDIHFVEHDDVDMDGDQEWTSSPSHRYDTFVEEIGEGWDSEESDEAVESEGNDNSEDDVGSWNSDQSDDSEVSEGIGAKNKPDENEDAALFIGDAGQLHLDNFDEFGGWSVLLGLSNIPSGRWPGRTLIISLRLYAVLTPITALVFKAVQPHISFGQIEMGDTSREPYQPSIPDVPILNSAK
ncbi:hypothetical protein IFR05_015497 [Cadophora sp. M221]|nr:hypothetical protein IFR05_015497 [Cadophora sp. M221]